MAVPDTPPRTTTPPEVNDLLRNVKALLALLGAAVAALLPALFPDGFFPYQLRDLASGASVVATVAFLLALSYPKAAANRKGLASMLAAVCGSILVVMSVTAVVRVEVGEPAVETTFLTGWTYTEAGRAEALQAGLDPAAEARATVVEQLGYDRAPQLWGPSYWANVVAYCITTLGLIFCTVFALVGLTATPPEGGADSIMPPATPPAGAPAGGGA